MTAVETIPVVVETASGKLEGLRQGACTVFRGIPFAAARRFRAPEPVAAWSGVRPARDFGDMAPQNATPLQALIGQNGGGVEEFNGKADLVFVDAPCSGSGAWRRRPEDAWRLKADEIERLHALQLRILGQAAALVKPGGRLVYVTCSVLARENEAVADAFEAANAGFRPLPVTEALATDALTDAARTRLAEAATVGRLRLSPASTGTDGFFVALYKRSA
jgi:hypothetical protein